MSGIKFIGGPSTTVALFVYGDVTPPTHLCLMRDTAFAATAAAMHNAREHFAGKGADVDGYADGVAPWPLHVFHPGQDALVERSRAVCAKEFLKSDTEVLIMLDHDMEWIGPSEDGSYEGDLCHIARQCAETRGIVGAVVSKKVRGEGAAVVWKRNDSHTLGREAIVPVHYVGAAFTAYHRDVIEAVSATMDEVPPGFKPIFGTFVVKHPNPRPKEREDLHLSEDWALCHRASDLGFSVCASMRPIIKHWGMYPYTVMEAFEERNADKPGDSN